jgi:hypothetical protein
MTLVMTVWGMVGAAWSQTAIDLRTQGKNVDFSGSASTRPVKTGTVLPAVCKTGDLFFKSDAAAGQNLYGCVAANSWVQASGGGNGGSGGGVQVQAGTAGGVLVTTANNIASVDADSSFVMTAGNHNAPNGNMIPSAGIWNLTSVDGLVMRNAATDPATCSIGELFVNTASTPVLKLCTAANTWTATGSGGGGGSTVGQVRTLATGTSSASCPSSPTTLASYTVPAATLAAGDVLDIRVVWRKTGTANIGQMKIFFGAQQVGGTTGIGSGESFAFTESSVFVRDATAQRAFSRSLRENTSISAVSTFSAAEAVSGNILVRMTGEACAGGDTLAVDWFDILVKKNAN